MANGQYQPGDRLLSALMNGTLDGQRLGSLAFQMLPTLPHESLIPMPRFLARPAAAVAPAAPVQVVQPAIPAQHVTTQPAPVALAAPVAQPSGQPVQPAYIPQLNELGRRQAKTVVVRITQLPGI